MHQHNQHHHNHHYYDNHHQGSRKCVLGIPAVSDKSSFVGEIEVQGYAIFLYFLQIVGQFFKFILLVGNIVYGSRFSKHLVTYYKIVKFKEHFKCFEQSVAQNKIYVLLAFCCCCKITTYALHWTILDAQNLGIGQFFFLDL